ncbi:MAG: hypothetical protein ACRYGK_07335 [Janthinobacterium lividum]
MFADLFSFSDPEQLGFPDAVPSGFPDTLRFALASFILSAPLLVFLPALSLTPALRFGLPP